MLEVILEGRILYVLMGIVAAVGILSKIAVNLSLKRLVWAAGNMNKSNHPLMRLVKAKFEHACMVSDTVENVGVFVDKYLYEYRVLGMKLHTLRRLEKASAAGCLLLGASGAAGWYALEGMGDAVLRAGAAGAVLAIAVYLFHLTTDEGYRLKAVKNYMVDYLENVCRRKYEKAYQKEIQVIFHGSLQRPDRDLPLHVYRGGHLWENGHAPQGQGRNIQSGYFLLLHCDRVSFPAQSQFPGRVNKRRCPRHLLSRTL